MKRNCVIVHGCPSSFEKAINKTYDKHWMPWIKKNLEAKEIEVSSPLMPEPWKPDYFKYKKEFEKYKINENTILIGHSCGCAFLVRWLGDTKRKIDKLILVAPWKIAYRENGIDKAFYEYDIDETIKSRVNDIIIFTSNDEEEDGKESVKIFHKALYGRIIELEGRGHYTLEDMGTEEFPELLEVVLR